MLGGTRCPMFAMTGRSGRHVRYGNCAYWACEGLIICQDEKPGKNGRGQFKVILPQDMTKRVKMLRRYAEHKRIEEHRWQRQERQELISFCQKMLEVIKEAEAMGNPSDPAVVAYFIRHRRNSSVSTRLRPGADASGYPSLPKLSPGRYTGRTAEVGEALPRAAIIHTAPTRKLRTRLILG